MRLGGGKRCVHAIVSMRVASPLAYNSSEKHRSTQDADSLMDLTGLDEGVGKDESQILAPLFVDRSTEVVEGLPKLGSWGGRNGA